MNTAQRTALAAITALAIGTTSMAQTIDTGSEQAYESSIAEMTEGMNDAERKTFSRGLTAMMLDRYPPATGAEGMVRIMFLDKAIEAAPRTMEGVTLAEIMAAGEPSASDKADSATAEREAAERRAAEARMEAERAAAEAEALSR